MNVYLKQALVIGGIALFAMSCKLFERTAFLVIVNTAPYQIAYTISLSEEKSGNTTSEFFVLEPGERDTITRKFYGRNPSFMIAARSSDRERELLRWHFNMPLGHSGIKYFMQEPYTTKIPLLDDTYSLAFENDSLQGTESPPPRYSVAIRFKKANKNERIYECVIKDKSFPEVYEVSRDKYVIANSLLRSAYIGLFAERAAKLHSKMLENFIKEASVRVVNTAPYKIKFSVYNRFSRDSCATVGWYYLDVGEKRTITQKFRGIEPQFAIHAQIDEREIGFLKRVVGKDEAYFEENALGSQIFKRIVRNNNFSICTAMIDSLSFMEEDYSDEGYGFGFVSPEKNLLLLLDLMRKYETGYKSDNVSYDTAEYQIADEENFANLYNDEDIRGNVDRVHIVTTKAKVLRSSLDLQLKVKELFPNFVHDYPFFPGFLVEDPNGPFQPGVVITEALEKNIAGDPMHFQPGDILTDFAGQKVFSIDDLVVLLYNHGTSIKGGIEVPIPYSLLRNETFYTGSTMYFFNRRYKGWPTDEEFDAVAEGAWDAITLGYNKKIAKLWHGDKSLNAWQYVQDSYRLRQFFPNKYLLGNIGGAVLSAPRLIFQKAFTKSLVKAGLRKGVATTILTTVLEIGEGVVWSIAARSPVKTREALIEDIKQEMKMSVGIGIAIASFTRARPINFRK